MQARQLAGWMGRHCAVVPTGKPVRLIACNQAGKWCMVRPMLIVVANTKGGVGKSTLAVHLAAWLHEQGHTVTLADCDIQHSSSDWASEAVPGLRVRQITASVSEIGPNSGRMLSIYSTLSDSANNRAHYLRSPGAERLGARHAKLGPFQSGRT